MTEKIKKAEKKYTEALVKAIDAETTRLTALDESKGCPDALTTTIATDKFTGDKKRKACIAMDEDNTDVNECYYENIDNGTGGTPPANPPTTPVEPKVIVWVDGKLFYCDAPADAAPAAATPDPGASTDPDAFKASDYKQPIINMINPYTCLPGGVSS